MISNSVNIENNKGLLLIEMSSIKSFFTISVDMKVKLSSLIPNINAAELQAAGMMRIT